MSPQTWWSSGRAGHRQAAVVMLMVMLGAMSLTWFWSGQAESIQQQVSDLRFRTISIPQSTSASAALLIPLDPWSGIPASHERDLRIAALLRLAVTHRLTGGRFEQQQTRLSGTEGMERVQVTTMWRGTYAGLRSFVEGALQSDRALSLDQLRLTHVSPEVPEVDAEMVWSFYQRVQAPGRPTASGVVP